MSNKKLSQRIQLTVVVFIGITLVTLVALLMPKPASATHIPPNWVPTSAENRYAPKCVEAGQEGSGYTVHGAFPNPSTVSTSSGSASTNLYAASLICYNAPYSSVTNIRITVTGFQRYSGTGNISIGALPSTYNLGNISGGPNKFTASSSKPASLTNLSQGANCWTVLFNVTATHGGVPQTANGGRWDFCVTVNLLTWNYVPTVAPAAGMPAHNSTVEPGDIIAINGRTVNFSGVNGPAFNFRLKPTPNGDPAGTSSTTYTQLLSCNPPSWNHQSSNAWGNRNGTNCAAGQPGVPGDTVQWGKVGYGGGGISGIPAGQWSPATRQATYQIMPNTPDGQRVCFYGLVSNYNNSAGGTDWRVSDPSAERVCYTVRRPAPQVQWQLEREAASINGSAGGCATANAGTQVTFGSTITNIGSNPVVNASGNLVDINIDHLTPGSISGTTLTRVAASSGPVDRPNVAIGGSAAGVTLYSLDPGMTYRIPANAVLGDVFTVNITYYEANGSPSTTPAAAEALFRGNSGGATTNPGPRKASACVRVGDFAYMKVRGSGVHNGGVWKTLEQCQEAVFPVGATQPIEGQNAGPGIGTSAEYGVTSLKSSIVNFPSAIVKDNIFPLLPRESLSFANSGNVFGNFLGTGNEPAECLIDLYEYFDRDVVAAQPWSTIRTNSSAAYTAGGNVDSDAYLSKLDTDAINSAITNYSGKAVVMVEGDLDINANITYNTNYNTASNLRIPSLVFVVKGNIDIAHNVTQLDGLYISIPNQVASTGGRIRTCIEGNGVTAIPSLCNDFRLVINGGFISDDIDFYRFIHGRLGALANSPASQDLYASEVFDFSPELYMANPFAGLLDFNKLDQGADYYTERAPVY